MISLSMVLLTLICPFLGALISIICIAYDFKNWRIYILCIAGTLAIMAYYYIPTVDSDIINYFRYVESYGRQSFQDILEAFISGRQYFITFSLLSWFIGHFANMHLLPAFVVFTVFFIAFYITCKVGVDYNIKPKYIRTYIVIILLALSFYSVTNNIRNILAFSLVGLAVFRDVYQNKRNVVTIFFYIVAFFLHSSVIVLILLRLFLQNIRKHKIIAVFIAMIAAPILNIILFLIRNIDSKSVLFVMFKNMVIKAIGYYTNSDASWAITSSRSGSILVSKILYIVIVFIFLLLTYPFLIKRYSQSLTLYDFKENDSILKYIDYIYWIYMMVFACIPMVMPEYWRFASLVIIMGGPIYMQACMSDKTLIVGVKITKYIVILSFACFLIWFRNLYLYSDISEMLINTLLFNPVFRLVGV